MLSILQSRVWFCSQIVQQLCELLQLYLAFEMAWVPKQALLDRLLAEGACINDHFYLVVELFDLQNIWFSTVCEIKTVIFFRVKNTILGLGLEKLIGGLQQLITITKALLKSEFRKDETQREMYLWNITALLMSYCSAKVWRVEMSYQLSANQCDMRAKHAVLYFNSAVSFFCFVF